MALVNGTETSGTLEVRVNDHDLSLVLLLAGLVEDLGDGISKLNSTCSPLLGATDEKFGAFGRLDRS